MTEADVPAVDQAGQQAVLDTLKTDPAALDRLRTDPATCAVLTSLGLDAASFQDKALAIRYLAIIFPAAPAARTFLFDRLLQGTMDVQETALHAILANYGEDNSAMRQLVAVFQKLPPGTVAALLKLCLERIYKAGVAGTGPTPPTGVTDQAWEDWIFGARSAPLRLLPRPDLRALLFDIMRRDPDGPVERLLESILPQWGASPPRPPAKKVWRTVETWDDATRNQLRWENFKALYAKALAKETDPGKRALGLERLAFLEKTWPKGAMKDTPRRREQKRVSTLVQPPPELVGKWASLAGICRDISEQMAGLHPKWPQIETYIQEFDTVDQRRVPGWRRFSFMFDLDFEVRQARVAARLAQFPDSGAVRRAFETMLLDRPALFPKVRDECDYYIYEPLGWRAVAWHALITTHWTMDDALFLARLIVESGPWDKEARKSKETILAVASAWPKEAAVLAFLAEAANRTDVGAFVRSDIAKLLAEAQAGKNIQLGRRGWYI